MTHTCFIRIGTNFDKLSNLHFAEERLSSLFPDIDFDEVEETRAVGMPTGTFLNQWGLFHTPLSKEAVKQQLKKIECEAGRCNEEVKQDIIRLDIDLLRFDTFV